MTEAETIYGLPRGEWFRRIYRVRNELPRDWAKPGPYMGLVRLNHPICQGEVCNRWRRQKEAEYTATETGTPLCRDCAAVWVTQKIIDRERANGIQREKIL